MRLFAVEPLTMRDRYVYRPPVWRLGVGIGTAQVSDHVRQALE